MENLFDYCCDYIESAHLPSGEMAANEKTYNLCVDYINDPIGMSENKKQLLKQLLNYK